MFTSMHLSIQQLIGMELICLFLKYVRLECLIGYASETHKIVGSLCRLFEVENEAIATCNLMCCTFSIGALIFDMCN